MKLTEVADVLAIPKLIELISELLATGYGEVTLRVVVQNHKVKIVAVSKTETLSVDSVSEKEIQ